MEFQFNECGTCLNHNEYVIYRGKHWYHQFVAYTAKTPSGWSYGYGVDCIGEKLGNWGSHSGVYIDADPFYESEREAFLACLDEVSKKKDLSPQIKKAIKEQQHFPESKQLELF